MPIKMGKRGKIESRTQGVGGDEERAQSHHLSLRHIETYSQCSWHRALRPAPALPQQRNRFQPISGDIQ